MSPNMKNTTQRIKHYYYVWIIITIKDGIVDIDG